jgi:hypothetical protein
MRVFAIALLLAGLASGQRTESGASTMIRRAQESMGGAEKLGAIHDVIEIAETTFSPSAAGFKMELTSRWIVPDQLRLEMDTPFGKIVTFTDGRTGWQAGPQGTDPMGADEIKEEAQGELFRQLITLVLSDRDASRTITVAGDNAVSIASPSGQAARVEFDRATGRPARIQYRGHNAATGRPTEPTLILSEWRVTSGVLMPHRMLQEERGSWTLDTAISDYKFNSGLTKTALSKQP